jgi:hypothetical protein
VCRFLEPVFQQLTFGDFRKDLRIEVFDFFIAGVRLLLNNCQPFPEMIQGVAHQPDMPPGKAD